VGALAFDGAGNVYVLDSQSDRVQKFTASGTYLTQWGGAGTDASNPGPGPFHIGFKGGLAVHGDSVYVADSENHRINATSTAIRAARVRVALRVKRLASSNGRSCLELTATSWIRDVRRTAGLSGGRHEAATTLPAQP